MAEGTNYATKSDVRALGKKLDATQADVRAIDQKLDATQADVRALDKKVDGLDARLVRVEVFFERLESKVDAIIETLPAKASVTDVRALNGGTSANVRKNSKDVRLLRNEVARLRK